jgi:hypothetical protein
LFQHLQGDIFIAARHLRVFTTCAGVLVRSGQQSCRDRLAGNRTARFAIDLSARRDAAPPNSHGILQRKFAMRFPKAFRRRADGLPPWAALDQEALRISAAMEHIQDHGNLDDFPGTHNEKLALMLTASRQGLVTWNRATQGYELTSLGRERLGMASILRKPSEPMNPAPAAGAAGARWTLGSSALVAGIAGVAIGAAAMAVLPGSSSKQPPRDRAAIATASKPPIATASKPPEAAPHQTPQAQPPRQADEASAASAARNPGIPCTAGKCLETGGAAEQATRPAPEPAANAAASSPSPSPSPSPPPQTEAHSGESGAAGAASGGTIGQEAALAPPQPVSSEAAAASPTPPAPAEATRARKSSRSARRAAPQEAVSATALDQPGYAQSTEQTPRAAARSTRHRHAATEQRRTSKSRRDYVEERGPGSGVTAPRYGGQIYR